MSAPSSPFQRRVGDIAADGAHGWRHHCLFDLVSAKDMELSAKDMEHGFSEATE
jgi:hypothetical protein